MPDPTPKAGASDNNAAPNTHKAFPDPSEIPTQENLDKQNLGADTPNDDNDRPLSPRDEALAGIYDQHAETTETEVQESIAAGLQAPAEAIGDYEAEAPLEEQPLPDEVSDDPLGEFAVMKDGKPYFKTVVDGQERLVPFAKAQEQAQKHEAAEVRLREASNFNKSVSKREANVLAAEQALDVKLKALDNPPPAPAGEDDGADLKKEARELVSSLMTGTENEAAEKLADVLAKNRASVSQTPVDEDAIARKAAIAARQEMNADAIKKDTKAGYTKFAADYPEIMADDSLFRYADSVSDSIAAENPEFKPSEIMLEAGKRTQDWVNSLKDEENPPPQSPPNTDRQSRKDKLVPMPRVAASAKPETPEKDKPETPQSVFAEIRESRGQAT